MSTFDVFMDEKKERISQSKAFANELDVYVLFDKVRQPMKLRTYYVQTGNPAYFIRIEGNIFTGIVSAIEDDVSWYPVFDYHGDKLEIDNRYMQALTDIAELSTAIEKNASHLAMNKLRDEFTVLKHHPVSRLSGFEYERR